MIGIVVLLVVSVVLLYWAGQMELIKSAFLPMTHRIKELTTGFLITAFLCLVVEIVMMTLKQSKISLNPEFTPGRFIQMSFFDLKSVVTEELVFRGALLFLLIEKIGAKRAIWISAILFGMYHWFSMSLFGNLIPMIVVFIGTGVMGYAWALAFAKTRSIFLPIGLHLGWNFTFNTIFSNGPLGRGWMVLDGGVQISDWYSLIGLWVAPIIILFIVHRMDYSSSKILSESIS